MLSAIIACVVAISFFSSLSFAPYVRPKTVVLQLASEGHILKDALLPSGISISSDLSLFFLYPHTEDAMTTTWL